MHPVKAEVLNLIEHYKEKYPEEWENYFFNKFETELPGGERRLLSPGEKPWEEDEFASEKKKVQTRGEFWKAIDDVIDSFHMLPEHVEAQRKRFQSGEDKSLYSIGTLFYIRLRQQGYNDHDLSA